MRRAAATVATTATVRRSRRSTRSITTTAIAPTRASSSSSSSDSCRCLSSSSSSSSTTTTTFYHHQDEYHRENIYRSPQPLFFFNKTNMMMYRHHHHHRDTRNSNNSNCYSRMLFSTTSTTHTSPKTPESNELLQRAMRLAQLDLPHESQILFDLLMKQLSTSATSATTAELDLAEQKDQEEEDVDKPRLGQKDGEPDDNANNNDGSINNSLATMNMINPRDLSRLQTTLMDSWIKYQTKLVQGVLRSKVDDGNGNEGSKSEIRNDDVDEDDDNDVVGVDRLKEIHHAAKCLTKIFDTTLKTTTAAAAVPSDSSSASASATTRSSMSSSSSSSHMLLAVLKSWANVCESSHHYHHHRHHDNTAAAAATKTGASDSSSSSHINTAKRRPTSEIQSIVAGIPQRMQHLLQEQQQSWNNTSATVEMRNEILRAWAYSFEYLRGTMAQQVFESQGRNNLQSYRYVMLAYAWSYETRSAFNATGYFMSLMKRLEREAPSISPRRYYYDPDDDQNYGYGDNSSINRTGTSDVLSLDDYHVLVNSWTKAGDRHAPSKVCTVLEIMNDAYKDGLTSVRPDLTCYRDALITVSRRQHLPEVGELADALMNELQRPENQHARSFMHPDTECYRAAIVSWKHTAMARDTTDPDYAIQRCFDILREMREAFYRTTQVTVQATTYDFNNVLHALSLSSKHRMQVLRQGQVLFQALLDEEATAGGPNADSYRYLLTIIRKSSSNEKLELAFKLMETLRQNVDDVKKSSTDDSIVGVFNAYIRVCASIGGQNTRGKDNPKTAVRSLTEPLQSDHDKAMTMALRSIDEIPKRHGLVPNSGTYDALIEVVDKLLPVDGTRRAQVLEQIFRRACSEGCVDQLLLERLKTAASTYQYADLVISQSAEMDNVKVVPAQWTRNVKGFKEGKKVMPLSIHGSYHFSKEAAEYRMRNLRRRNNQALLRGGRMK